MRFHEIPTFAIQVHHHVDEVNAGFEHTRNLEIARTRRYRHPSNWGHALNRPARVVCKKARDAVRDEEIAGWVERHAGRVVSTKHLSGCADEAKIKA